MNYLRAVLNGDAILEKNRLKELITISKRLGYSTKKYEKELKRITKKATRVKNKNKKENGSAYKYQIRDIRKVGESIVLEFNRDINRKDFKYYEQSKYGIFKDVFIIKGKYKKINRTKIKLQNIDRTLLIKKDINHIKIEFSKKHLSPDIVYVISDNRLILKNMSAKYITKKKPKIRRIKPKPNPKVLALNNTKPKPSYSNKFRQKIVVIDPGHGGRDSGAINGKRYEKNAVLSVSRYLSKYLKQDGYKVYMTRNKDKYVNLKKRTHLANNQNADIYISIHINSIGGRKKYKINGVETYFLSPARSDRAKKVAEMENQYDTSSMNESSKSTLLTILNRSKITESNKLAIDIQKNMLYSIKRKYSKIRDGGVKEGPFWILVGASMPSVLVELGYISHPSEVKRLFKGSYQKLLARGIADGVNAYFAKQQ
jgi:N-acetylmuramoyl-L-alanine amidase